MNNGGKNAPSPGSGKLTKRKNTKRSTWGELHSKRRHTAADGGPSDPSNYREEISTEDAGLNILDDTNKHNEYDSSNSTENPDEKCIQGKQQDTNGSSSTDGLEKHSKHECSDNVRNETANTKDGVMKSEIEQMKDEILSLESSMLLRTRGESVGDASSLKKHRARVASGSTSPCNRPKTVSPPKPARVVASLDSSPGGSATNSSVVTNKRNYRMDFTLLPKPVMLLIFRAIGCESVLENEISVVCKLFHTIAEEHELWADQPILLNGKISHLAFKYLGQKNKGTEGVCYKMLHRGTGVLYAMKKARVYPAGEGVPYYMLRELAFLQGLSHEHIATLELIKLVRNELYVFFRYVEKTLFDLINPMNDPNGGNALPPKLTKLLLYQVLQGVAFCHRRGVLHRNLKPKHLLVDVPVLREPCFVSRELQLAGKPKEDAKEPSESGAESDGESSNDEGQELELGGVQQEDEDEEEATASSSSRNEHETVSKSLIHDIKSVRRTTTDSDFTYPTTSISTHPVESNEWKDAWYETLARDATVKISDFALVRSTSIPLRNYTTEVVTLWYRAPEVLMGGEYFAAVDMWSVGCVFGEMVLGKPLFPGICEVDQVFQIFTLLGTPTEKTWPGFTKLKHYNFAFPNWKPRNLQQHFPNLEPAGVDLLRRLLNADPVHRITADEALGHRYFDDIRGGESCAQVGSVTHDPTTDVAFVRVECTELSSRRVNCNWQGKSWPYGRDEPLPHWYFNPITPQNPFMDYSKRTRKGLGDLAYFSRYYQYLKQLEFALFPLQDCMNALPKVEQSEDEVKHGSELKPHHRSMLVDWLVEVIDVFDMSLRSVFLAVNYIDRYLCRVSISRKNFQLLGATCLHIASKCEDVSYIGVDDLVVCADRVYANPDVLLLEERVLNVLNFHLAVPTAIDFLNVFIERLGLSVEEELNLRGPNCVRQDEFLEGFQSIDLSTAKMACYITELSLQEHSLVNEMPSKVAASALLYALHCTNIGVAGEHLAKVTGYEISDLLQCASVLHKAHAAAPRQESLLVIRKRYLGDNNYGVGELPAKDVSTISSNGCGILLSDYARFMKKG